MQDVTTFTTALLLALAIYTSQNLIRYVRAKDVNGVLAIVLAWLAGLGVAEWAAHASITSGLVLITDAPPIGKLDFGSLCLLALGIGSAAPAIADFFKSRDFNDSAAKPKLVA